MGVQTERKFTDRDVREDPWLASLARDYALRYTGEFEFMVAARELAAVDNMPVAVVRGVLNCMRADPLVAGSLPAPRAPLAVVPDPPRTQPPARQSRPVHEHEQRRPDSITMPVTFKKPLVFGVPKMGYKLHVVDHAECKWSSHHWRPLHYQPVRFGRWRWNCLQVKWFCQQGYATTAWPKIVYDPTEGDFCLKCLEFAKMAGLVRWDGDTVEWD